MSRTPKLTLINPGGQVQASVQFYHERLARSGLTHLDLPDNSGPVNAPTPQFRIMNPLIHGGYAIRYDREDDKYINFPKGKHDIFALSEADYEDWRNATRKPIVEGQLKALAYRKYFKRPVIGITGCRGWSKDGGKLLPKIANAIRPGDEVDLLIDGDIANNPEIADATALLAALLLAKGAVKVRVPQLPPGEKDKKVGLDDWIQQQPTKTPYSLGRALAALPDLATTALKARIAAPPPDANQHTVALALVDRLTHEYGTRPVYTQGQLYLPGNNLWTPMDLDALAMLVGKWFGHLKTCKRLTDFKAIAWLAAQEMRDDRFFEDAKIGIAGPVNFWVVGSNGRLKHEPLTLGHKARNRVSVEPNFKLAAPRFESLLTHCFGADQAKRKLLQCLFGAAVTQQLWKFRVVGLLIGLTTTGKTTLLNLLRYFFPLEMVSATNPQRWDDEYYRAALGGKLLNIVGDLDPHKPIPGGAFKQIVGNDLIEGRHPTHRPFAFVCQASHFFNTNQLPPTQDRSDAFFVRWRIIAFTNRVTEKEMQLELERLILHAEGAQVFAWMLQGAAMVARLRTLPTTDEHHALIAKWRHANNSALQFISDSDECVLDAKAEQDGAALYQEYQHWAPKMGLRAFGRTSFYTELEEGAGSLNVVRVTKDKQVVFRGVKLKNPKF